MIPENWIECDLKEVLLTLQSGSRPRGGVKGIESGIPSLGGEHLNASGGFDFTKIRFVPEAFADRMNNGQIQPNDTLIVKDGATTGKTSFVGADFPHPRAFVNEHVFICRPIPEISARYLFWFLFSPEGNKRILENFKGSAQGGINTTFAANVQVPLAPLAEQQRIVAKLDELMERLASARAKLERVPRLLSHFRRAVLSAACSGALTRDWREENDGSEDDWTQQYASEACESVQSGSTPSGDKFRFDEGVPFLKVYNIVNQKIAFEPRAQFVDEETHRGKLKRAIVKPNDVLMNIVGPPLAKVAIVPDDYPEWNMNQALVLFRPKAHLDSKYLYFLLCSTLPYVEVLKETRGSAGQANISLTQCREMIFNIPPLAEQIEIVARVNRLFALADSLEARFDKAQAFFERMSGALLAKAFRGELVPQNPDDESAAVTLERLRAQSSHGQDVAGVRGKVKAKTPRKARAKKSDKSLEQQQSLF